MSNRRNSLTAIFDLNSVPKTVIEPEAVPERGTTSGLTDSAGGVNRVRDRQQIHKSTKPDAAKPKTQTEWLADQYERLYHEGRERAAEKEAKKERIAAEERRVAEARRLSDQRDAEALKTHQENQLALLLKNSAIREINALLADATAEEIKEVAARVKAAGMGVEPWAWSNEITAIRAKKLEER